MMRGWFSIVLSVALATGRADVVSSDEGAQWLSVPNAPTVTETIREGSRAADGTSWFVASQTNEAQVTRARWTVTGLGIFEVYVNGKRVGADFLKPGFTHYAKTKYSFTYDVTSLMRVERGEGNLFAAEVSAGWWRDKILTPVKRQGFLGKKSAFRGALEIEYADGAVRRFVTNTKDWRCGIAGPVTHAAIFDGEEYDARIAAPLLGEGLSSMPEVNDEFKGEILPSAGGEVCLRRDLVMTRGPFRLKRGETLVVDFGQNCAAVPEFRFSAKRGTVLTVLPAEMLNDADKGVRGCDGLKGSVYRRNLRVENEGMRIVYTFAGKGMESYLPRFTYFGYRYLSLTATDDVTIDSVASLPVSSIRKEMETGKIEVGDVALNQFIKNVYWGQLSNYLNIPTDCPQRNERLGWSGDTQVFCEAGAFNADTRSFFRKFTRDLRDSCGTDGGYPSVAPFAQYGNETFSFGYADVGVIVPWTIWRQYGDTEIVRENFDAMAKFVRKLAETKYDFEGKLPHIYADWLSYEKFESCSGWSVWRKDPDAMGYRRYLAACYWLYDARLLSEMAAAIGKDAEAAEFKASSEAARAHIRKTFLESDGLLLKAFRDLQTACVFALKFGIVEGAARKATADILVKSIAAHGGCLQTGFLGTSFLMDALGDVGEWKTAYDLLFQHKCPSWLYSVDQGATTVWERWNSYTKAEGFGPEGMNSFNHYSYGSVLAWIYRNAAGIAADPSVPGFRKLILAPKPDQRLGFVKAEYKSVAGLVKSAWRYEGDLWVWEFSVPAGATARVILPDGKEEVCEAGVYVRTVRQDAFPLSVADLRVRDPFVVAKDGTYYLYESKPWMGGEGVDVRESKDLVHWSGRTRVMTIPDDMGCIAVWAPEVHCYRGRWYLFVTLTMRTGAWAIEPMAAEGWKTGILQPRGTWVYVADSPRGPFCPVKYGSLTPKEWMCLDGTLFEENGRPYLVFCHEWCQVGDGRMMAVELRSDLSDVVGEPRLLFKASSVGPDFCVTDGPFLHRCKSGALLMTWSNRGREGYSVYLKKSMSGSVFGPWKNAGTLFAKNGGHGMLFRDFTGMLRFALHQPNDSPDERMKVFPVREDDDLISIEEF